MSTTLDVPTIRRGLADLVEKAVATYAQALIAALIGSSFFESLDWSVAQAAAIATIPAGITVIVNAVNGAVEPSDWPYQVRAVMRVVRTGAAAFLGYLIAVPVFTLDKSMWVAAGAAGSTALLAAIKAELARLIGSPASPAVLPASFDQPPPAVPDH